MTDKSGAAPVASLRKLPKFSRTRCKQCGICAGFCPKDAIGLDAEGNPFLKDPDACTGCSLCEHLCPDFGVKIVLDGSGAPKKIAS